MAGPAPATGLARRSRRLSDRETEQRMMQAAAAMVHESGLTVSLEHISFEDVIRAADVSRSAAYRRWPYKDLFFSDLVKELAKDATPSIVRDELGLMHKVVAEHASRLDTAEGRHNLVMELVRQEALLDFQTLRDSPAWRTYVALNATCLSLAPGELRDQIQAAIAASEKNRIARIARAWEQLTRLFGYRLRPELDSSFEALALLLAANLRGLVIMAMATPDLVVQHANARPFGATHTAEWSLGALGLGAIASAFLEPDPGIEWDDERIAAAGDALRSWTPQDDTAP